MSEWLSFNISTRAFQSTTSIWPYTSLPPNYCKQNTSIKSEKLYFSKTLMCFSWKFFCMPTTCNTFETFSLGNTNGINHFILGEYRVHWHLCVKNVLVNFSSLGKTEKKTFACH